MTLPLTGRTVALAECRQLEELAALLTKEGAETFRCPLVGILDAEDAEPVRAWLRDLIADRFALVVFMTGEGVRRLLTAAEAAGWRDAALAALARTRTLPRGPKPIKALKEVGITPSLTAAAPTTDGLIATLRKESLAGVTVGVVLHGEANPALTQFLETAGAQVAPVQPYRYAPAADADRVVDLIHALAEGRIDLVMFTSSPQIQRLFEVAQERDLLVALAQGWQRTRTAAVGPIAAESLRQHGVRVDVCPEQGFVMKNLVQYVKRELASPASRQSEPTA